MLDHATRLPPVSLMKPAAFADLLTLLCKATQRLALSSHDDRRVGVWSSCDDELEEVVPGKRPIDATGSGPFLWKKMLARFQSHPR